MTLFFHFFPVLCSVPPLLANNVLNYVYGAILFWNYHHQHYELWRSERRERRRKIVLDLGGAASKE
jgi:hypothetical protein